MSNFKIRKIEISRDSGGVRSSALDMFYTKDSTFDFLRRKKMFRFFFIEKKSDEKKSRILPSQKTTAKAKFLRKFQKSPTSKNSGSLDT